jgi:hypothetical protein
MGSLTNDHGGPYLAAGSTRQLKDTESGSTVFLDTAAGSTVTLPAYNSPGDIGAKFRFIVSVLATSNSHKIQVANAADFMIGGMTTMSDDPATAKVFWAANSGTVSTNSDTITLNRTTTGSVSVGEHVEAELVAANTWHVRGLTSSTGTEATPFSAAV